MMTAIVGINWGDEGKGRMADLLSSDYDIVVRYQGGNTAGHTVINDQGKFVLNLLPSGILRPKVINIMGNGMIIDLQHLWGEIRRLNAAGIKITPDNLKISDRASICFPYHILQDTLEKQRVGDNTCPKGSSPVLSDKHLKKVIRMGDLRHPTYLRDRLEEILAWKNHTMTSSYHTDEILLDDVMRWLKLYGTSLEEYICDTGIYLDKAIKQGKNVLFEAQLGALRDIDFGIYPFTSSSSTIAAYATIGAGIPQHKIDKTIGIMKAYSSCVGEGPFTAEMTGEASEKLREAGHEYVVEDNSPHRVGPFDVLASKYGTRVQGADEIALTKLDVLSHMDKIPLCIAYEMDGHVINEFPVGEALQRANPVLIYIDGWKCDISKCRTKKELPTAAVRYIRYIESSVGCRIKYVSVGPQRDEYIVMYD